MASPKQSKVRYWIGVASREHARLGVRGGFAQFSHGRLAPARRLSKGDWVIYYSGRERYGQPDPCQRFVAVGRVVDSQPTQVGQFPGFRPWRRRIKYRRAREVEVHPLIERLSFIKDKGRWGGAFRFGFLEVDVSDFRTIAQEMLPRVHWKASRRRESP